MTAVIDVPIFSDEKVPRDEPAVTGPEFSCETCGKELTYAGRGRKPKYCEEHRKGGNSGGKGKRVTGLGQNAQLAAQAAEALIQVNGLLSIGLMLAQMPVTAETLKTAEDGFREQAYNALLTDPALCKTILKGGTTSGKVSLLIAYGMLGAAVAPVGVMEFRQRQETRRVAKEAAEAEAETIAS